MQYSHWAHSLAPCSSILSLCPPHSISTKSQSLLLTQDVRTHSISINVFHIYRVYQNAETTKSKKLTDEESKNGNKIQHTKPKEITKMEIKSRWSCANAVASGSQQHNTTHDIVCAVCVLDTWFWCCSVPASQVYRVVVKEKNYKRLMSICLNCGNIPFLSGRASSVAATAAAAVELLHLPLPSRHKCIPLTTCKLQWAELTPLPPDLSHTHHARTFAWTLECFFFLLRNRIS